MTDSVHLMDKVCPKCTVAQRADRFQLYKGKPNGWCRSCRTALEQKRRRTNGISERPKSRITDDGKTCMNCHQIKPLDHFWPSVRGSGGYSSYCKPCQKSRFYDREEAKKITMRYRLNNRERWLAIHRVLMFERRTKIKVTQDGTVTDAFLRNLYNTPFCFYCEEFVERNQRTADHKHPLSKSGAHSSDNLVMACFTCNSAKRDLTQEEYEELIK